MLKLRKSQERGFADHGWLKSYHSFSFAHYYDPKHMHFGNLRVINEDFIAPNKGFGEHPHNDMEIITYVISGELKHRDSMENSSVIRPNEVQIMSAGKGVFHSEFNNSTNQETHLLQIWILPQEKQINPKYGQKSFANQFAEKDLVLVVSKDGRDESLAINQEAEIFVGKFKAGKKLDFAIKNGRKIWIQLVKGSLFVNEIALEQGDAAAIIDEKLAKLHANEDCEFLLFDL